MVEGRIDRRSQEMFYYMFFVVIIVKYLEGWRLKLHSFKRNRVFCEYEDNFLRFESGNFCYEVMLSLVVMLEKPSIASFK